MGNSDKKTKRDLRGRLLWMAKDYARKKKCLSCKKVGEWKVTDLYEYGDMDMPSSVVLVCECGHNESFAEAKDAQGRIGQLREEGAAPSTERIVEAPDGKDPNKFADENFTETKSGIIVPK